MKKDADFHMGKFPLKKKRPEEKKEKKKVQDPRKMGKDSPARPSKWSGKESSKQNFGGESWGGI